MKSNTSTPNEKDRAYAIKHFLGELSPKKSFWINLVLPLILVLMSLPFWDNIETYIGENYSIGGVWLSSVAFLSIASLVVIWQIVGVWRSLERPNTSQASSAFVKTFLIFYALLILPNLFLLGMDLRSVSFSDFSRKEFKVIREGGRITIAGAIEYGISDVFANELQKAATVLVVLDSKGGMAVEARKIASIIEQHSLPTVIAGECLSACTTIFAAGSERITLNKSNIGFHSPSFLFKRNAMEIETAEEYFAPLLSKGFPTDMIESIIATPPREMWYAPTIPLYESGFITDITSNLTDVELRLGINPLNIKPNETSSDLPDLSNQQSVQSFSDACDSNKTRVVAEVSIETIGGSSLCFPVPKGLIAFKSGDYEFEVFDSMTYEKNKLLLALVVEEEFMSPNYETDGLNLYARIEHLTPDIHMDKDLFEKTKGFMTLYYEDVIKQIQEEKLQTELQKGSQRISQTIQADVRVQDVKFNSIKLIENSDHVMTYEFEMDTTMVMESEFQRVEQTGLTSYLLINDALIMINWYETQNSTSSRSRLFEFYEEYLTLLNIKP